MSSIALFGGWMGRVSLTVRTLCIQTTDDNDLGIRRTRKHIVRVVSMLGYVKSVL